MSTNRYRLREDGVYEVRDYHEAHPFSSFLSGIAGLYGIPLWCYYVNRGQAVACFGVADKDHALLEFHSAKLHQHRNAAESFRTFLRLRGGGGVRFYEPFRHRQDDYQVENLLRVLPHGLELEETNATLGITVRVRYTTLPDRPWAGLVRQLHLTAAAGSGYEVEVLDGLPRVMPYGQKHAHVKLMPFVNEGYLEVRALSSGTPFIKLTAQSSDSWEVELIEGGNFFCGSAGGGLLPAIVDPERVFGDYADFDRPYRFLDEDPYDARAPQGSCCQTCCAFLHHRDVLAPGGTIRLESLWGTARAQGVLADIAVEVAPGGFADAAWERTAALTEAVAHRHFVHGASTLWSRYQSQTYVDNILRGGLPLSLPAGERTCVFHVYSRKHGDLERDYNYFQLAPTYFSQGNGNFRDVNQNRRHDVWFNPDVGADNVRHFFNLLQLDGYNPLVVEGALFSLRDAAACRAELGTVAGDAATAAIMDLVAGEFAPGELLLALEDAGVTVADRDAVVRVLLGHSDKHERATFGEGYWTDHWLYNFDHLDSYLAIFPDNLPALLLEDDDFVYYDTAVRVLPRDEKHVVCSDGTVRQVDAIAHDPAKAARIAARTTRAHAVRVDGGDGPVYRCNLLQKILCLLVNKLATVSPSGMGLDMEAGRPGWHDSINGLPGVFGATTSECYHLVRAIRFLRQAFATLALEVDFAQLVPVELATFFARVHEANRVWQAGGEGRDLVYWQTTAAAKERYRAAVHYGLDGAEQPLARAAIDDFCAVAEAHLLDGLARARDPVTGLPATYLRHQAVAWEPVCDEDGRPLRQRWGERVRVTRFTHHLLPVFLEAPAHALRLEPAPEQARTLHAAMRDGPLYDRALGMYLLGDDISAEGPELGRLWSWSPGWFENENVFLHAEHKYLLGLLAAGLYDEFFADLRRCAICFQPPARYGRNPLENASFIMSSRQPRPQYHGRGYQPRSSGTTAEVLEMAVHTAFGARPFAWSDNRLRLRFEPVLPGWMFSERDQTRSLRHDDGTVETVAFPAGSYAMRFLGCCLVVYDNPARRPTYGPEAVTVAGYTLHFTDGATAVVDGADLDHDHAVAVRCGQVRRVHIALR